MTIKGIENLSVPKKNMSRARYESRMLLTPREKQVLEMICDGMSNEEIARVMDIQVLTVKFHLKKIYDVFHTSRRHVAIIQAVRTGMVRPSWINEVLQNAKSPPQAVKGK